MKKIGRREFAGATLAGSLMLGGALTKAGDGKRPNIIYILLDDAGYGDLSCYGQKKFKTPNMDRLADEGIKFTSHYSGSTVCAPSRCSLMTGRHTGHTVVRGNRSMKPEGQYPLPDGAVTVAGILQKAGYRTGAFGKWGLGPPGSAGDPRNQGFDEFFGYICQSIAHNYYPEYLWHNGEKVMLNHKTYSHDLIMEKALEFVRDNREGPFFCYLPVTIPHASMHVPRESKKRFKKEFWQYSLMPGIYDGRPVLNPVAAFAGMMTRLDSQIGTLLDLLLELGIDENTVVMLSSDNGPHKEGGHLPSFFDSNGPFRGHKRDLYEGGIRVPMLARWPGRIRPRTETGHQSAFWDVMPTMCDIAGVSAPEGIDGISFAPTLSGKEGKQKEHEYLYWEFHEQGGKQAVRKGDWKAVRLGVARDKDAPIELYDLARDPDESDDVSAAHPDVVKEMARIMEEAHEPSEEFDLFDSGLF